MACESDDPCVAHKLLTKVKDRGGLTYIKESTFYFFFKLELMFREVADASGNVTKSDYVSQCTSTLEDDFMHCILEGGQHSCQ
jgi:hypothetical protein